MSILRSRRLESVFGASFDHVTADNIRSLVSNGVTEEFDLDFKRELYGNTDKAKRDLAGDVAALANTAGGVIVIGVAEDDQARAIDADGVVLTDTEKGRMLQIVASGVSPLPAIDIIAVPETLDSSNGMSDRDNEPTRGFYLVAVPKSASMPHAVIINDAFRFPTRNGSTTRYLSEPEVAGTYRERFAHMTALDDRLEQVEQDLRSQLEPCDSPWLVVSLVPSAPGHLELTDVVQRQFTAEVLRKDLGIVTEVGISFHRTSVRRRRLIADDRFHAREIKTPVYVYAEFHCDGSGAFALRLIEQAPSSRATPAESEDLLIVGDSLISSVLSGLKHLGSHTRDRTGTSGNALIRASLMPPTDRAVQLGSIRHHWCDPRGESVFSQKITAETVADIDGLASPGPELVSTAARLAGEVAQGFGIAEIGHITKDGEVRLSDWYQDSQVQVRSWATGNGIAVVERNR
ncbi:AlbA family DNA-binding domain-containing protein [Glutamicibacter bergerei]